MHSIILCYKKVYIPDFRISSTFTKGKQFVANYHIRDQIVEAASFMIPKKVKEEVSIIPYEEPTSKWPIKCSTLTYKVVSNEYAQL